MGCDALREIPRDHQGNQYCRCPGCSKETCRIKVGYGSSGQPFICALPRLIIRQKKTTKKYLLDLTGEMLQSTFCYDKYLIYGTFCGDLYDVLIKFDLYL